jgi:hypothetical protein
VRSFLNIWYCKKFTTKHTEKILFRALSCQPLALSYFVSPLCVLNYYSLFPSFSYSSDKIYQLSPALSSASKKLSTNTLLCYKPGYNSSVISINRYSLGEHRESLVSSELNVEDCETLWFHIVPLFFIALF